MQEIRWESYPLVAQQELAQTWLTMQRNLQLAPATIDVYGRNLNDYLAFCSRHSLSPSTLTRESLALYIQDLATRANPRGANVLSIGSGHGLSRATMLQHLTVIRLYHDFLIEKQIRPDNPVGRGKYVAGTGVSTSQRGLLSAQHKLPWMPFRCCEKRRKKRSPEGVSVYSTLYFSFCTYLTISKSRWKDNKYFWLSTTSVGGS